MTESQLIQVDTDAGPMPVHQWLPPGGTGPGLVLVQEIFGVSDYIRQRATDLAALGYVVLAPEFYWRLADAGVDESQPDFLQQAIAVSARIDWPAAVRDGVAALEHLRHSETTTGGVGLIGFCFGGGLAFNISAVDSPDALVSYYGSGLPNLLHLAPSVTAPSLHHFGTADDYLQADTVAQIRDAISRPGVRIQLYEGAGHAFDNPRPAFHHAAASTDAWESTVAFLESVLPTAFAA
ncbi:MAG: dienelactone hydrolase family protein [Jatrophihabitans sp.]